MNAPFYNPPPDNRNEDHLLGNWKPLGLLVRHIVHKLGLQRATAIAILEAKGLQVQVDHLVDRKEDKKCNLEAQ